MIKTGLRKINSSYSRISLQDLCEKVGACGAASVLALFDLRLRLADSRFALWPLVYVAFGGGKALPWNPRRFCFVETMTSVLTACHVPRFE